MKSKAIAVVASIAGLFALAAPASAQETTFSGETADGVGVKLAVGEFGNATSFTIAGSDVECREGTLSTRKITFATFDISDPGSFHDKSRDASKAGALKFKSKTKIAGAEAAGSWEGTYKRTTRVLRNGDEIDVCRVTTTWQANKAS